ncbi:MAG: response regulator [Chloroflexota bacterium]
MLRLFGRWEKNERQFSRSGTHRALFNGGQKKSKNDHSIDSDDDRRTNSERDQKAKRIIIAEDAVALLSLYKKVLELNGHIVVMTASDGMTLLKNAKEGKCPNADVALLDYNMGLVNGLEVATELLLHSPEMRVIIASADDSVERESKQLGLAFLMKPFTINELLSEL